MIPPSSLVSSAHEVDSPLPTAYEDCLILLKRWRRRCLSRDLLQARMVVPSLLDSLPEKGNWSTPAICDGCRACRCGRHSHPPTPGRAATRPFPRWRWRDACLKVRSDAVRDGTSCGAKQREGHAVLPIAAAEATIHLQPTFWCSRSASKGDQQPLSPFTSEESDPD